MYLRLLAIAVAATALVAAPAAAAADQHTHGQGACCDKPCCKDHKPTEPGIVEMMMENDPQLNPAPPVRQTAEVWFKRPVLVAGSILLGRYVIEHDNDRQARGEPCTHIYAYGDRTTPVAAFHCTHLERDRADHTTAVLYTTSDGVTQRLVEFQFTGETSAHGVPIR